jgi:hypothetical protein
MALACAAMLAGCRRDGCVGGDDGACVPPTACAAVRYECSAGMSGTVRVEVIGADEPDPRVPGPKATAAFGDILLENELVRVVLDNPDHPQGLAPSGGSIIDFSPRDPATKMLLGDQANGIYQAAGLLPRDAVLYTTSATPEDRGASDPAQRYVAAVFRGTLVGDPRVTVVTRYELRACEPGVRVRTDLYNGAPDPNTLYVTDGYFWGDHGMAPFVPGPGLGFRAPEIDLTEIATAWREWPFLAARSQAAPDLAYASIACDRGTAAGFNDPTLTAAGIPLVTTLPGDGVHFERYLVATPGAGLAPAVREALHVRSMVHNEPAAVTVKGRVLGAAGPIVGDAGPVVSLLFYEPGLGPDPDDLARRVPWSEAVPALDGTFSVTLPPDRSYRMQPYAFGRPAAAATSFAVAREDADLGDVTVTASAQLRANVTTAPGQPAPQPGTYAELVLVPFQPPSGADVPSFYGLFPGCDPMLGPPHGGSPACNRAVTHTGGFNLLIPPGQYYVYVTRGPFTTLKRAQISVSQGEVTSPLEFLVESLPLLPAGAVSGDFHVHGAASFDSSIPDQDRVVSFLATGLDVVVATDHDVVTTYEQTLNDLSATGKMVVIPGVEQTPNILWFSVPGEDFPKTLGHFNFWPLLSDRTRPHNGAPWDELREPGQMMDEVEDRIDRALDMTGVRQLNHPMIDTKLGRDQGFLRAINYDVRTPIAGGGSFAAEMLLRKPGGNSGHQNLDWNAQEVMSGISPAQWLRYRALWFSLLSQGITRAGTANSDTHSLSLEHAGYPRNIVFGDHQGDAFTVQKFDDAVRQGHMVGTNGPVLQAVLTDAAGKPLLDENRQPRQPGMEVHGVPREGTQIIVSVAAAPWIPLREIRVFVNGTLKVQDDLSRIPSIVGVDPFGSVPATMPPRSYKLSDLVPAPALGDNPRDVWVVIEVGMAQATPDDTDGDGLPDLPEAELPGRPASTSDPRFHYQAIVPGGWPVAFTNPFLLDLDGDGHWHEPGL